MLFLAPLPELGGQLLQVKPPPPLFHLPLRSSREVSGLARWVSRCRQVLAAHLKWSLPSISVSLTLKDANPAETLGQARVRGLALLTKVALVEDGGKSFLAYETLNGVERHYGSRICKEIELRAIRNTTQLLPEYGRRRSKCGTIIWQSFSCYSTLSIQNCACEHSRKRYGTTHT